MSGLWEPCQFNDESHVYCEPPSELDAIYDDLLLKVTGNMLVGQKIEVAKMVCKQLNENAALREQLAEKNNALSEIIELYDPYTNAPTDKFMYERAKAARGEDDDTD